MQDIDESELSPVERLGLAWCRLNGFEWDELVGPKPEGFDELPDIPKAIPSKYCFVRRHMESIEQTLGHEYLNLCWWRFELGKSEEEWLRFREELKKTDHAFYQTGNRKQCHQCGYRKLNHLALVIRNLFFKAHHLMKSDCGDLNG